MPRAAVTALAVLCLLLVTGSELRHWLLRAPAAPSRVSVSAAPPRMPVLTELASTLVPMPPGVPVAHASALALLPGGDLLACWWAGQSESATDVRIYVARLSQGHWGPAREVVERDALGRQLGFAVRRIGNPAVWVAHDGSVHLYMVATGLGGWAASRVVQLVSTDGARSFTPLRVLPLTPLFDTSALVRSNPVALDDGGWLLPVYFELGHKYGMVVSFDRGGVPRWVSRIGASVTALQPALLPLSPTEVLAVMRDIGPAHRMQQALSLDAGRSWTDLPASELPNLDTSVAATRLEGGGFVLVHNDLAPAGGTPRQWLRLSASADARHWTPLLDVRLGAPHDEYSYPSVQQVGDRLHVLYTSQRKAIGHTVYAISYAPQRPEQTSGVAQASAGRAPARSPSASSAPAGASDLPGGAH